eukprot:TRINITY_DN2626_c1_g1_i1.p2 TRINITY_DN2626_c1_g1~~TRINITY_DN2626_c1_g1_i1.p2  ORF type:complete len:247 (+),score=65.36 TRINITY_DN2626_c1_g1_i1:78-818(+)
MPKLKKGFKSDRLAAKRDPAKLRKRRAVKTGQAKVTSGSMRAAGKDGGKQKDGEKKSRPKVVSLDTKSLKTYVTGFHKRKMQRQLYARRKAKEAHRAAVNSERRDRRERRRQLYNQVSQFQIDENWKVQVPEDMVEDDPGGGSGSDSDEDVEEEEEAGPATYDGAEGSVVEVSTEPLSLGGPSAVAPPPRPRRRPAPAPAPAAPKAQFGFPGPDDGGFPSAAASAPSARAPERPAAAGKLRLVRRR